MGYQGKNTRPKQGSLIKYFVFPLVVFPHYSDKLQHAKHQEKDISIFGPCLRNDFKPVNLRKGNGRKKRHYDI
jgi:hypothetical protein